MSLYIGKKAEEEEAESSGDENQDDDDMEEEEEEEIIEESGEEDEDDDDNASSNEEEEEEGEGEATLLEAEQKRLKELKGQTEQSATKEVCTLLGMTWKPNHWQFRPVSIVLNNDNHTEPPVKRWLGLEVASYVFTAEIICFQDA